MSQSFDVMNGKQRLRVFRAGAACGPVLVFVHGYPDTHAVWNKVLQTLAPDHQLVSFDVRGAGASSVPKRLRDYRLQAFVGDLKAVIDRVSPHEPVHLIGHDWGSIHSWESVTDDALKGRIASFTSISGPCLDHAVLWIRKNLRASRPGNRPIQQLLRSWYIAALHLPLVPYVWQLGLAQRWPRYLAATEGAEPEPSPTQADDGVHGAMMYRANFVPAFLAPRTRIAHAPVQVIAALRDRYVSPDVTEHLEAWVPQLWRREIDAGHWLLLTHPQLIAAHIRDFVASVERGSESRELSQARVQGALHA